MKVAFDTSVLVAAMISTHRDHPRAVVWLDAVSAGTLEGVVSVHVLGELWSVLKKLPVTPPISPRLAVVGSPPIVVPPDPPAIRF